MPAEPALRFWLDYVEAEGGVAEEADGSVVVILPEHLQGRFDLPEDLSVTSDPDVARADGALLIIPGQPMLTRAAETLLEAGDVGWAHLPWPASPPPDREVLQAAARDRVAVDHGRVDLDGQPGAAYLPALHVGVLVEYVISLEDRFQEKEQLWVDGRSGRPLSDGLAVALDRCVATPGPGQGHRHLPADSAVAVAQAHAVLEGRALERRRQLVVDSVPAREAELARVAAYYDAALASIASRRGSAPLERQSLYDAQASATESERARRLQETEEKFAASHVIRPFRLHLVGIPALVVPVVVRRGARSYPLTLDWYLPFASFGVVGCAHCDSSDVLVAGRERLGCRACLPRVTGALPSRGPANPNGSAGGNGSAVAGDGERLGAESAFESAGGCSAGPDGPSGVSKEASGTGRPRRRSRAEPAPGTPAAFTKRLTEHMKRVRPEGNDLVVAFWQTAGRGERWSRTSTVPRTPLEAVYRLYGVEGPLRAVGIPPGLWVSRLTASTPPALPDDAATLGSLEAGRLDVPFTLRWRLSGGRAVVSEVLPWHAAVGSAWLPVGRVDESVRAWLTDRAARPGSLGPVEDELWLHVADDGLPFVMRCLTLWWRLQGQRRLRGLSPEVAAAAAVVVTGRRCGARTSARVAADRHGATERDVTAACGTLDQLLEAVGPRLW